MSLNQWLILIVLSIIFTAAIKIIPIVVSAIFKDKKISYKQRKILEDIITKTIKDLLELSTIKDKDELKSHCINLVICELKNQNITAFSEKEVEIMVALIINTIDNSKIVNLQNKK
ncbi:MAG: hypothetical protein N2749_00845 [Clostridia bacterium]|nr:hypothetical protein [Clostridia bacterium]